MPLESRTACLCHLYGSNEPETLGTAVGAVVSPARALIHDLAVVICDLALTHDQIGTDI